MKIALCTTTINVPHVLELYRAADADVPFFIAGDEGNSVSIQGFCANRPKWSYLHPENQKKWKCSELLGWHTLARRNIAFLEALKSGAEVVVSVDDDNLQTDTNYFARYQWKISRPHNGLVASSETGWYDPGQLLVPYVRHRGIPHGYHEPHYAPITNAKIGVMAGLVLGDSDVDSTTRIERPFGVRTTNVVEFAHGGVVVDLKAHTVFNSQNTAVIRELVPAWFMMPGVGRMDDIYASLIVQRVAKERELHVHFGQPYVFQQRNQHDLLTDLEKEIDGYRHVRTMAELLDAVVLPAKSIIDDTRIIYEKLRLAPWIPEQAVNAAMAWLEDCESCV